MARCLASPTACPGNSLTPWHRRGYACVRMKTASWAVLRTSSAPVKIHSKVFGLAADATGCAIAIATLEPRVRTEWTVARMAVARATILSPAGALFLGPLEDDEAEGGGQQGGRGRRAVVGKERQLASRVAAAVCQALHTLLKPPPLRGERSPPLHPGSVFGALSAVLSLPEAEKEVAVALVCDWLGSGCKVRAALAAALRRRHAFARRVANVAAEGTNASEATDTANAAVPEAFGLCCLCGRVSPLGTGLAKCGVCGVALVQEILL